MTQLSEDDYADLHAAVRQYVSCAIDNGDYPKYPDEAAETFCAEYNVNYARLGDMVERIINEEVIRYETRRNA
ncbi:hypothetical protein [Paenibacillus odorifer]|uniref:hypothetical protein n=1 Tax=Paenibacillus odorifer TaxID=189426 RepID=UPI00096FFD1C|nr:hypothetical protein [Paenibacillus odorifer]OMD16246.1 hypothetical protein BJP50_18590 [Paenibacillus odorifer]